VKELTVDKRRLHSRVGGPCDVCETGTMIENDDNFQCPECSYVDWDTHDMPHTNIFVRAQHRGRFGSYDVSERDAESLLDWFDSRDADAKHKLLLTLLGHTR
jgi:hypothetical protein